MFRASPTANGAVKHASDSATEQPGTASGGAVSKPGEDKTDNTYSELSSPKTVLLLTSVFLSMFLVALDRTIISTVWFALPVCHGTEASPPALSNLFSPVELLLRNTLNNELIANLCQAIPEITNEFNSLPDVGWYGSAYLLTCSAFQLLCGKLYTFYAVKVVLLSSIVLFEVGSAICGAAPTSTAFIIGRAIAGVSAAGIFAGSVS